MTDVQPAATGRRARGGADARRAARTSTVLHQAGYIRRKIKLYEPFTDEQLELIEHNAELVLEEIERVGQVAVGSGSGGLSGRAEGEKGEAREREQRDDE
jgi:histidinol dehydrogenase